MPGVVESITSSRWRAVGAGIVLGLVLLGLALPLTAAAFGGSEGGGEVFLEPADAVGADPFTDALFTTPTSIAAVLPDGASADDNGIEPLSGDAAGLYGGTTDNASCDAELLISFLTDPANADKAAAWAGVHGIDVAEIASYVDDLTPMVLRQDTRVTNHGFRDGEARPLQSVLQAGTAVLVDDRGVPRARCACGNPLLEPQAVSGSVDYQGDPWDGFSENAVFRITSGETVERFILVDLETGELFERPVGGDGSTDRVLGEELDEESSDLVDLGDIPVPEVVGLESQEAIEALEAESFEVTVIERPSDDVDAGFVILTDPRAGSTLAAGAEILLIVSSGPAEENDPRPVEDTTATSDGPDGTVAPPPTNRPTTPPTNRPTTPPTNGPTTPPTNGPTTPPTEPTTPPTEPTTPPTQPEQLLGDFRGADAPDALAQLKELGISASTTPVESNQRVRSVVTQDPAAGTPLSQVSDVRLGVAQYTLPNYGQREMTASQVQRDLDNHGLTGRFLDIQGNPLPSRCSEAFAWPESQNPGGGRVMTTPGTEVTVVFNCQPTETPVRTIPTIITVPDTVVTIPRDTILVPRDDVRPG